ncbi:MAG: SbcC/MukB-like Walker B domain-containing protein, partial [Actinomycetes bacterium]
PPTLVVQASAAARAEIGSLQRLADHEVEADRVVRDMDTLERTIVATEAQATEVSAWLDAADDRRAALSHARELAAEAATELPVLREALTVARSRVDAARRRDDLTLELATARDELRRRTDAAQEKRENWLGVRQARLDGMAAELSAALVPGADCPVCGSIEHPAPATARPDAVTRQQEDAAGLVASTAETERSEAQARVGALEVSLAEARVAAGGEGALDVLLADVDTMTRRFETIQAAAATLETAEDAVRAFDEEREGRVRQQVGLDERRKEARVRAVEQQVRLQRLHEVLDDARGDDPSIASRAARLERLAHDCDRLASEVTALERLRGAVDEALSRAELAAAARNLGSLDTVADAARDDERVVELDAFRQRHDAELATVTELLADPEITAAARLATPDMAALDAAAETAERAHAAAVGLLSGAESRVAALDRLHVRLTRLLADREPLAAAHRTIDGLSRLAEGKSADNRLRMSLSGYVLAARLEQVAAAASERLERMSSGRYRLVHTADSASGRGRGGLHLRVLDAWTGADRDPATLSGGESFSASLALALGLADVVTAESGGSLLETLFVDEGFGTLDDDTLDEVMSVLDDLRDGGRVVGLVSHVADLRQRIPVQLVVEKGRGGSTIRQ